MADVAQPPGPHASIARKFESRIRGEVRFGRHDRMLYATDASIYQVEPLGVVVPASIEDARVAVALCGELGIPVLPRGGGTSLAGQAVGPAVILDLSVHCGGPASIETGDRTAVVEPGLVLDALNRQAAPHGLMFGPDVATSTHATLGGMIGNNSAGAHSILYGRTVENLDAVSLALADGTRLELDEGAAAHDERVAALTQRVADVVRPLAGEIRQRYPRIVRRVNGYNLDLLLDQIETSATDRLERVNLAHLICGAEGTLGLVLQARVRLVETPAHKGLALAAFASLQDALVALPLILDTNPSAVELIDDQIITLARNNLACRRALDILPHGDHAPGAVLYVEYFADEPGNLETKLANLGARLGDAPMRTFTDPDVMASAWTLRHAGEPLLHGVAGNRKPVTFIEDLAVDPAHLGAFVEAFEAIVARHRTTAAYYAHASVGCLHIRPMIALHDPADRATMEAIAFEATELVRSFGGALSGEHGDGRARSSLLEQFYGRALCDGFRAVKAIFDPGNLFNPGNIVAPQPMTTALRVLPEHRPVRVPDVETYFSYANGFAEAVEACNGAGVCRKRSGGSMCPSYRALLDERHATRGRGNALRLAITGQFSLDGRMPQWNDPDTIATLDLCLSCKACKAECPSNVDVAKLKAEYTAQRYATSGGPPWRVRQFGNVRAINRVGSALWPVANPLGQFGPTAAVIRGVLGIHPKRSLPGFGPSLYRWLAKRGVPHPEAPAVVLVPDCFSVYSEPHVGRAAVGVLETLGYRVELPRAGCCGRAMISQGMLNEATDCCAKTARSLFASLDRSGAVAVVGLEPSCVSAITDEWTELDLGLDRGHLARLVEQTMLIEQFIAERWDDHPVRPTIQEHEGAVVLHGHCHQKALWGIESSSALLEQLLGSQLEVLDSGCCGLAGAFGYAKHRYELSMAIGEQSLFGRLRERPDATIVAPGTSCRQQILDGSKRRAIHPIELVAEVLA